MAATDPGQPFGASLSWPESSGRPSRTAGALVVIEGGEPMVYLERGGKSLITFAGASSSDRWAHALTAALQRAKVRIAIATIDGEPAGSSPARGQLEAAGFARAYRGWSPPPTP